MHTLSPESLTLVIARCFAEHSKEIYQIVKRACSAAVFFIIPTVLWRSHCRSRPRRYSFLLQRGRRERLKEYDAYYRNSVGSTILANLFGTIASLELSITSFFFPRRLLFAPPSHRM